MSKINYCFFALQLIAFPFLFIFLSWFGIASLLTPNILDKLIALTAFSVFCFVISSIIYAPWFAAKNFESSGYVKFYFSMLGCIFGFLISFGLLIGFIQNNNVWLSLLFLVIFIGHTVNLKSQVYRLRSPNKPLQ